jgi:nucleoid-associated protein YgaU
VKPATSSSWKEAGEAPAPVPVSNPVATSGSRTHTVRKGDTIYSLARLYYAGDVHRWHAIYDANRDKISNPDQLKVGQVLVIPG